MQRPARTERAFCMRARPRSPQSCQGAGFCENLRQPALPHADHLYRDPAGWNPRVADFRAPAAQQPLHAGQSGGLMIRAPEPGARQRVCQRAGKRCRGGKGSAPMPENQNEEEPVIISTEDARGRRVSEARQLRRQAGAGSHRSGDPERDGYGIRRVLYDAGRSLRRLSLQIP